MDTNPNLNSESKKKGGKGKLTALLLLLLALIAGGVFLAVRGAGGRKQQQEQIAQMMDELTADQMLLLAQKLFASGEWQEALKTLAQIDAKWGKDVSAELREQIVSLAGQIFAQLTAEGTQEEILAFIQDLIDSGDTESAFAILAAIEASGDKSVASAADRLNELKKAAIEKAVANGKADEALQFVQKMIAQGSYDEAQQFLDALSTLLALGEDDTKLSSLKGRLDTLKRQAEVLQSSRGMTGEEKLSLAERLIAQGHYDEAQALLDSLSPDERRGSADRIASLEGQADTLRGADQTGEVQLERQQQEDERIARAEDSLRAGEEAERKAQDEQVAEQAKVEEERRAQQEAERIAREQADRRVQEERQAQQKRLDEERKAQEAALAEQKRQENERKAQEETERVAREETERKAREDALAQEKQQQEEAQHQQRLSQQKQAVEDALSRGKQLLAQNKNDQAIGEFRKARDNMPTDEGERDFAAQKYSEAAEVLFEASERNTGSDKDKLYGEAITFAQDAFASSPESVNPTALFVLGMQALSKGDYKAAENHFREATERDPAAARNFYQLGRVLAMQKKYESSLAAFGQCIKLDGEFAPAHYNSGFVNEQMGKKEAALASYQKAYALKADYESAYMAAGRLCFESGNYNAALKDYSAALKVNPSRSQTYQELGSCYAAMKDFAKAEEYFVKALSCADADEQKNAITYYNLSCVLFEQGKTSESLSYAKRAYDQRGKLPSATRANVVYNYALLTHETGDESAAVLLYQECLKLNANHVKANTNLAKILLAEGDAETAEVLLTRAHKADPTNFEVNNNLGSAYRITGDWELSSTYYKEALKAEPDNAAVKENLAKSYAAAKNYKEARQIYEQLVKADQSNWGLFLELAKVCLAVGDAESGEKYLVYLQAKAPAYNAQEVTALLSGIE